MSRPDKYAKDGTAHAWSAQAVRNIPNNHFYLGEMTYGRRTSKSVGNKKMTMLQIPECCTSFNVDTLEEFILTMLNKELLIRGEAASQEKNLHMLHKNQLAAIKKQMADLQREQKQAQASKDEVYEKYAVGRMPPEEYRERADELSQQIERLSQQMKEWQEKFFELKEVQEKIDADMKQIIRYSHMEKITQELVDTFIERIRPCTISESIMQSCKEVKDMREGRIPKRSLKNLFANIEKWNKEEDR